MLKTVREHSGHTVGDGLDWGGPITQHFIYVVSGSIGGLVLEPNAKHVGYLDPSGIMLALEPELIWLHFEGFLPRPEEVCLDVPWSSPLP